MAASTVVVWTACAALVALAPEQAMWVSGHMIHADLSGTQWSLTWVGFGVGLVTWTALVWIVGLLSAWMYGLLARVGAGPQAH